MAFVWFSQEQYWGKPWMNYCTFLLFNSFISDFKDCQHHESISLYNVHNYRALVQHWKVEQRHNSFLYRLFFLFFVVFCCFFLVLVTALLLSLRTDPYSTCRSLLLSHMFFLVWVDADVREVSWPRICLKFKHRKKHKNTQNLIYRCRCRCADGNIQSKLY